MKIACLLVVIIVVAIVIVRRLQPKIGEILPADEMKRKYGLTAENRPEIHIDPELVPESLRDLIPMAEKWGIGDDIIRGDVCDRATEDERKAFQDALRGRLNAVTAWLDGFDGFDDSSKDNCMTEDAGHFMYMQIALDEMGLWTD